MRMPDWVGIHRQLTTQYKLRTISPKEAQQLVQKGTHVIVDVRPPMQHEQSHPEGSQNAPLFQPVNWGKPGFKKFLRAAAFMANGVTPVEENDEFLDDVRRVTGGKGAIFACEAGGTMRPTPNFPAGKASRSLKGAWKVLAADAVSEALHLDGGVYGWYQAGLPMVGDYDKSNLGRTPNATVEPTGQYYEERKAALEEAERKRQEEQK